MHTVIEACRAETLHCTLRKWMVHGGTSIQAVFVADCCLVTVQAFSSIVHSWFSRKFATGAAILLPMVITVYISWSFLAFFDGIFSVRIWNRVAAC